MNKNDLAFPYDSFDSHHLGLTKREYISTQLLAALISTQKEEDLKFSIKSVIPKAAIMYADELLKQLNQ